MQANTWRADANQCHVYRWASLRLAGCTQTQDQILATSFRQCGRVFDRVGAFGSFNLETPRS
jgi:hypothetical protein